MAAQTATANSGGDADKAAITPAILQADAPATFIPSATGESTPPSADHTLVLHVSEDAWRGDATFTVTVDNQAVGLTNKVSVLHSSGGSQDLSLRDPGPVGPTQ